MSNPCPVCGKLKKDLHNTTCSNSCANTHFRSGINNPNYKGGENRNSRGEAPYRVICFSYHKKECVICGEDLIVEVHHLDGVKENNAPENLIPICSTHHKYWHSRHKHLIENEVLEYAEDFKNGLI